MVLAAIIGDLGCGKTLTLTYLAIRNYFKNNQQLYANYNIDLKAYLNTVGIHQKQKLPINFVNSIEDLENMNSGFFAADELWLWLDSRMSKDKKNKAISGILIKSRKRNIQIGYTTQSFRQIDVRVRNITDFIVEPVLSRNESHCKVFWYTQPSYMMRKPIKIMRFETFPIFEAYKTTEEIEAL